MGGVSPVPVQMWQRRAQYPVRDVAVWRHLREDFVQPAASALSVFVHQLLCRRYTVLTCHFTSERDGVRQITPSLTHGRADLARTDASFGLSRAPALPSYASPSSPMSLAAARLNTDGARECPAPCHSRTIFWAHPCCPHPPAALICARTGHLYRDCCSDRAHPCPY